MSDNGRKASWTRLPDESWGVLVSGPKANVFAGKEVPVRKRSGETQNVQLAELVQSWEQDTKATYMVAPRKKNGPPPMKPRGKVEVSSEDLKQLLQDGSITVKGVTIVHKAGA